MYMAVGGSISSREDDGDEANSQLLYDLDGGVRKRTETEIFTPFYTELMPWSPKHPGEMDGIDWSVWLEFTSGDSVYDAADSTHSLDTWYTLDSDIMWAFDFSNNGPSTAQGIFLVKLSDDGGSTDFDTKVVTVNLEILQP